MKIRPRVGHCSTGLALDFAQLMDSVTKRAIVAMACSLRDGPARAIQKALTQEYRTNDLLAKF